MHTRLEHAADSADMSIVVEFDTNDPLDALRALRLADQQLDGWLRQGVTTARDRGTSWPTIAAALDITEQAAWEFYNADVRAILDRAAATSDLTDDEAMSVAVHEVRAVRRKRCGS